MSWDWEILYIPVRGLAASPTPSSLPHVSVQGKTAPSSHQSSSFLNLSRKGLVVRALQERDGVGLSSHTPDPPPGNERCKSAAASCAARESLGANSQPSSGSQNSVSGTARGVRARAGWPGLSQRSSRCPEKWEKALSSLLVLPLPPPKLISPLLTVPEARSFRKRRPGRTQTGVATWGRRSGPAGRGQAGETAVRQAAPEGAPSPAKS